MVMDAAKKKTMSFLVHTKKNGRPYSFEGTSTKKVIELVQKTRGYLLKMSGLRDWTIDESEFDRLQNGKSHRLRMKGHYFGVEDQPVDFVEWAYFIGDKYYQISFHQPGKSTAAPLNGPKDISSSVPPPRMTQEEIKKALEAFRPEGL